MKSIRRIQKILYAVFRKRNIIFWKISNVVPTPRKAQYAIYNSLDTPMDDPNLTMEEYIRLEEEKARKCRKVFNWQTATYRKIKVSAIVNKEIDFRISFDESDDEDYTVIYDANSFSYKMISVNNLKTNSENDYEKVMPSIPSPEPAINMAPLPPREQRHRFLRVSVFDFGGLPDLMFEGLTARLTMEHRDEFGALLDLDTPRVLQFQLGGARRRMSWREFIVTLGLHTEEEMQTPGFGVYWAGSARQVPEKEDMRDYWIEISSARDFLGTAPSYTLIRDPILRLCHRLIACSIAGRSQAPKKVTVTDLFYLRGMDVGSINVPYLLARYLRLFAVGRKSGAHISVGQFVARLADHFRLLTAEILGGLSVIAPELLVIDMAEIAWVAPGPERQPDAVAGAPAEVDDVPVVNEGGQDDPAPIQAPQQQPPPPPAPSRTMVQRLGRLEEDVQGRFSKWMMTCMTQLMEASGLTYQAFDGSFRGSSSATFERRTRQRTGEASTSTAQQGPLHPDI
ncbi:hypothetical protein Tco_1266292 [Tanacetum coccineum]